MPFSDTPRFGREGKPANDPTRDGLIDACVRKGERRPSGAAALGTLGDQITTGYAGINKSRQFIGAGTMIPNGGRAIRIALCVSQLEAVQ